MAKQTTIHTFGLPGRLRSYSAKMEAAGVSIERTLIAVAELRTLTVRAENRTLKPVNEQRILTG